MSNQRKPSIYRGLTPEQRAELDSHIVFSYQEGVTMDQIADDLGISKSKVWSVLLEHKIASRKPVYVDVNSEFYRQKGNVTE